MPSGVLARRINANHTLYLNLDGVTKHIELAGRSRSILRDQDYENGFDLAPYEPEFVETK